MRIEICTLDSEDLKTLGSAIPTYVIERADEDGYYTIGIVKKKTDDPILGIAQFFVNITRTGECFGELIYIYMTEKYRKQGMGGRMLDHAAGILKRSGISIFTFLLPYPADKKLAYPMSQKETESFFGSCGFFKVKPDLELWVTTMDELVPDISQKKVTRYIRLTDR